MKPNDQGQPISQAAPNGGLNSNGDDNVAGGIGDTSTNSTNSQSVAERRLFPLHMTPFERYMMQDDTPHYPMTFILQFEFSGCIDRKVFQRAIDQALTRQPMLRCNLRVAKGGKECWVPVDDVNSQVLWDDWDTPIVHPRHMDYIDLKTESGFRCWVRHDDHRARCIFLFHHAAIDGIAAYQFVGDILWFYATEMGDVLDSLPEVNPTELRNRLRNNLHPDILKPSSADERKAAVERIEQPIQALACSFPRFDMSPHTSFPDIYNLDFDKDQFRKLRLVAQERGQSVNDALLESLFAALVQWNHFFAEDAQQGKICVNMPLDLRNDEEPQYLAANYVSYALVQRTPEEILSSEFADGLRMELAHLKHTRHNSAFIRFLIETPLDEKGNMSNKAFNQDCLATVVFSNTGDPTRRFWVKLPRSGDGIKCGNLVLTDVTGSPPLRKGTRAAIGVLTYQRKLRLSIRCDRNYLNESQSKQFLNHFAELFVSGNYCQLSSVLTNAAKDDQESSRNSPNILDEKTVAEISPR